MRKEGYWRKFERRETVFEKVGEKGGYWRVVRYYFV